MDNQENKKKGKIIKIIVEIVAVICIAVIMFFVGSSSNNNNSSNDNNSSSNNQETSNKDNDNEVYTVSDTELKKYAELNFRHYHPDTRLYEIDEIERYEDCGNGRYIYIVYYYGWIPGTNDMEKELQVNFIDVLGYPEEIKVASYGVSESYLTESIKQHKAQSDEEFSWNIYDKSSIISNSDSDNNSSSNATSSTYQDDDVIIALALKKWFEQDSYTKMQYEENIPSVYSGNISQNSDGSVNVHIVLYREEIYNQCMQYNLDIDGAKWAERNIKLTKEEVTK